MGAVLMVLIGSMVTSGVEESINDLRAVFAQPPREFSTGPLWVWNDLLTEAQIRQTLGDLARQQVKQVWVHPRPGLMTPYLSEDWFDLWRAALDEAERLDMNIWIYDENSYPSGFAGGYVPEAMPESRALGMDARDITLPAEIAEPVLAVYEMADEGAREVTAAYREGSLPDGDYVVVVQTTTPSSPWYGGAFYVDLLRPGVTETFLELTMERYREEIGHEFGRRVPGVFTDEPHLASAPGLHYTPDLVVQFQQRWGYDLRAAGLGLWRPVGDWHRVRHNYYQTLLDLFIERWARPYHDYCEAHGLEFTGHYWEHGWPEARIAPDNMAMYAWHQRPAIDTLFNQYNEGVNAQFGNVRAVLELGSAANQFGRRRTLCEAYGGSGWDVRFEDLKRIGDWLYVLGVNTLNEHLSQITNRGARKADYPPSFSHHAPWFEAYHVLAAYFTRLSAALSHGEQRNDILVLEPTTTAWMYQGDGERLRQLGSDFQWLVTHLAKEQVPFDLGSEDIIARNGAVNAGRFVVGQREYHTVVLPAQTENLNQTTVALLERFLEEGGQVLFMAPGPPSRLDGAPSDAGARLAAWDGWRVVTVEDLLPVLRERMDPRLRVLRDPNDAGILFHHRRQFSDGDLVFLVNTSIEHPTSGRIAAIAGGIERWRPETGAMATPYPFTRKGDTVEAAFDLPPCGSLLLFLPYAGMAPGETDTWAYAAVEAEPGLVIHREALNVLTLDYMDLDAGGATREGIYFYQAARHVFGLHGFPENPWDHAVQFRDHLIAQTFPDSEGFEIVYRFEIAGEVPSQLYFVVERCDLYTITCNGQPVEARPGEWWLDRAFAKLDVRAHARTGHNEVRLTASGFSMFHELQPAYVLGDFRLAPTGTGFRIEPDTPLAVGSWKEQGHPLYGDKVSYTQRFEVPPGMVGKPHRLRLPHWYGAVAQVAVNGHEAGFIWHAPWECSLTPHLRAGVNDIRVTVYGTPKNPLGPHHGNPPLGIASPHSFRAAPEPGPPPGADYHTLDYGLFEPFVVLAGYDPASTTNP